MGGVVAAPAMPNKRQQYSGVTMAGEGEWRAYVLGEGRQRLPLGAFGSEHEGEGHRPRWEPSCRPGSSLLVVRANCPSLVQPLLLAIWPCCICMHRESKSRSGPSLLLPAAACGNMHQPPAAQEQAPPPGAQSAGGRLWDCPGPTGCLRR